MPLVRLELTLLAETDFESVASTNSATGAQHSGKWRRKLPIRDLKVNGAQRSTLVCNAASLRVHQPNARPMSETHSTNGLISALEAIADDAPEAGLSLGEFVDALGERAFGIILFAMALPISIPFLYGVPQIMALPMMALSAQMALGREEPWLPARFKSRQLSLANLQRMAAGGRKWFGWLEALSRPRLTWLSGPLAERLVGAIFVLFCASILVPLPATNTTPGIALAIAALGLLTRDGLLVLAGLVLGLAWITLLMTLFLFFGDAAIDVLKDFIRSLVS